MNQPVRKFTASPCSAAVFINESREESGQSYRRVVLQRVYRDAQGQFQATTNFRITDIPKAMLVLGQAYEYLVTRAADKRAPEGGSE